jgi:RNA polymerase sigma factor (sigma-70 family)
MADDALTNLNEAALIGAFYDLSNRERAEAAFEVLRTRHEARVLQALRRAGCAESQLDDIAQDAFLKFWLTREKVHGRFDPAEGEFGPWLTVVARNRLEEVRRRAAYRRRRPMPKDEVEVDSDPSADMQRSRGRGRSNRRSHPGDSDPSAEMQRADFTRCLDEWEQGLGEEDRQLWRLLRAGQPQNMIAGLLELSNATVSRRRTRLLEDLRQHLEQRGIDQPSPE